MKLSNGTVKQQPAVRAATAFARLPLVLLLLLPLAMLALCLAAGAQLDAALADLLACMDPGSRALLLANLMLAALSLPPLWAVGMLLRGHQLRHGVQAGLLER